MAAGEGDGARYAFDVGEGEGAVDACGVLWGCWLACGLVGGGGMMSGGWAAPEVGWAVGGTRPAS